MLGSHTTQDKTRNPRTCSPAQFSILRLVKFSRTIYRTRIRASSRPTAMPCSRWDLPQLFYVQCTLQYVRCRHRHRKYKTKFRSLRETGGFSVPNTSAPRVCGVALTLGHPCGG